MKKFNKIIFIFFMCFILVSCSKDNKNKQIQKNESKVESTNETKNETKVNKEISETDKENEKETKKEVNKESLASSNPNKNHIKESNDIAYDVLKIRKLTYSSDYSGEKIAFLTFDDGPSYLTKDVLSTLKEKGVKASFFIPGTAIYGDRIDTIKDIYKAGHAIGTHSYTHDYDILYPNGCADTKTIIAEEKKALKELKNILGDEFKSRIFRYPGGHMSWDCIDKASDELAKLDIHWIDWNTMNGDAQPYDMPDNDISRPTTVEEVISNFDKSKNFTPNPDIAVILMHDASGKDLTAKALPKLIDHLKSQGYKFGILE